MKVAIYARYSSDNQRDASIEDQIRLCRLHAEKQGWQIVEQYTDHAISGASMLRPGIQALISDATRGRFDLILSEAMDRLSRDQEDIAGIFKRMSYADVKIVTLSEGEVTHLHVGLKGTMYALFLKDLADKTRRGQRGRVEAGKSGGGNAYGYDVVRKLDANGEPIRGDRTINEAQAEVVRRIFRDYAVGKSAKTIAFALNREGIPAPSGGDWGFSTINGNPKRGNGILNNEMYVGKIVWNRQRFIKDPDTGKRQARPNPEEDWVIQEAPELRILDDALWQAVKARQTRNSVEPDAKGQPDVARVNTRRRPKYLFSGLTKCACCGGGYSMISATLIGCSTARNKGTCDNRINIRRDELESRVLNALRNRMLDPKIFAAFCDAYTREINRLRMEPRAFGRIRQSGDGHGFGRCVLDFTGFLPEEMGMVVESGVVIAAGGVDGDFAEESGLGELPEGVVDGGERDVDLSALGFGEEGFRREMPFPALQDQSGEFAALSRRAQSCGCEPSDLFVGSLGRMRHPSLPFLDPGVSIGSGVSSFQLVVFGSGLL